MEQACAEHYLVFPEGDKGLPRGGPTAGKRIGLYGGSFNPPHKGHLLVAETALKRLKLDALWWLVSPGNPLKDTTELAPLGARIKESEALAGKNPKITITAFEQSLRAQNAGAENSAAMLARLVPANPQTHFVWVMGADNLQNFHLWHNWREIMRLLPVAAVSRPHFGGAANSPAAVEFAAAQTAESRAAELALCPPPAWVLLRGQRSALSSTALRQKQKRG